MRTPDDAEGLKNYVKASGAKTAVIAGGGFIGLEVAENLLEQGLDVTVMDMAPQVMPGFDPEFAAYGTRHLEKVGIHVSTSTKMEGITGSEKAEGVQTDKGLIPADVVVLSLGIRPNTAFLKETGLEFAKNGAIMVDKSLRTNLPGCLRRWGLCGSNQPFDRRKCMGAYGFRGKHGRSCAGRSAGWQRKRICRCAGYSRCETARTQCSQNRAQRSSSQSGRI